MEKLGSFIKLPIPTKSKFSSMAQVEGGDAAKKLGAKDDRDYMQVVQAFKLSPDAARRALSFTLDATARTPIGLFLWKYREIRKQAKKKV